MENPHSIVSDGDDFLENNLAAGIEMGSLVRSTLGPLGADKLVVTDSDVVDKRYEAIVSSDAGTILSAINAENPIAQMIMDMATDQQTIAGDGTTAAVMLAGELLKQAQNLYERGIHPVDITDGYQQAAEMTTEILNTQSHSIDLNDTDQLETIVKTGLTGLEFQHDVDLFAKLAVTAARRSIRAGSPNLDYVKIESIPTGQPDESELIEGTIIGVTRLNPSMPAVLEDATTLVIGTALEPQSKESSISPSLEVDDPETLEKTHDVEDREILELKHQIRESGADAVFVYRGINRQLQDFFQAHDILAIRRTQEDDISRIAAATGADIVMDPTNIPADALGLAGKIELRKIAGDEYTFITDCANAETATVLLRANNQYSVDKIADSFENTLKTVSRLHKSPQVVPGGGAAEIEIVLRLRSKASAQSDRTQLSIEAFADAIEVIPKCLAANAGMDQLITVADLRASHMSGNRADGISIPDGTIADMASAGVYDPLGIKTLAIVGAQSVVTKIMRMDDALSATDLGDEESPPTDQLPE